MNEEYEDALTQSVMLCRVYFEESKSDEFADEMRHAFEILRLIRETAGEIEDHKKIKDGL